MRTNRLFAITLALLLPAAEARAQGLDNARAFVKSLYDRYRRGEPEYLGRDAGVAFSSSLVRLIRRDQVQAGRGYAGAVGWDPICSCQDPDGLQVVGLDLHPETDTRARAHVHLKFSDGSLAVVRLDLGRTGAKWRVTDVRTQHVPSLLALLRPTAHPKTR